MFFVQLWEIPQLHTLVVKIAFSLYGEMLEADVVRYVPVLRWKKGERTALEKLSANTRSGTTPYFVLGVDNFKGKKATKKVASFSATQVFVGDVISHWGKSAFFLDASQLVPGNSGAHPLSNITTELLKQGGTCIPVMRRAYQQSYLQAVIAAANALGSGVCLTVSLSELASASTWIHTLQYPADMTDVVIDLRDSVESIVSLGSAVNQAFIGLAGLGAWRSVTLVGTSIPENFAGYGAGLYTLPRTELLLWQQLSAIQLPYRLDYGDYGTISIVAPPADIAWGYPITVKYTLANDYLICRGVRTRGAGSVDMGPQLTGHAQAIVAFKNRGALPLCYGDQQIDNIASGGKPGGLLNWVGYSLSRHIEITRSSLP